MKHRSRRASLRQRLVLPGLILACQSMPQVDQAIAVELIVNDSFEIGARDFDPAFFGWTDGPRRGNDAGYLTYRYSQVFEGEVEGSTSYELPPGPLPESGFIRPMGAGEFFASRPGYWNDPRNIGGEGSAMQFLDVSRFVAKRYTFSAWLASRFSTNDTDYGVVMLEFFDAQNATGNSLGSVTFDGNDQSSPFIVGSLNYQGGADPAIPATKYNWTMYRSNGLIPPLALSAAVVLKGETISGPNGQDAFIDLVSLQVVPEPRTAALLAIALLGFAAVRRRDFGNRLATSLRILPRHTCNRES